MENKFLSFPATTTSIVLLLLALSTRSSAQVNPNNNFLPNDNDLVNIIDNGNNNVFDNFLPPPPFFPDPDPFFSPPPPFFPPPPPPTTIPLPPKVLDIDEKPLKDGNTYMIMFGRNAGVGLEQNNGTCPPYVAQQRDDTVGKPLQVIIHKLPSAEDELIATLVPEETDTIFEGTPVAVEFKTNGGTTCTEPLMWKVVEETVGEGTAAKAWGFVKTGGSFDKDGIDVLSSNSKFQITKADDVIVSYKFRSCPSITGDLSCQDVGKLADTVTTRPVLVVDDSDRFPFYIQFKKV